MHGPLLLEEFGAQRVAVQEDCVLQRDLAAADSVHPVPSLEELIRTALRLCRVIRNRDLKPLVTKNGKSLLHPCKLRRHHPQLLLLLLQKPQHLVVSASTNTRQLLHGLIPTLLLSSRTQTFSQRARRAGAC